MTLVLEPPAPTRSAHATPGRSGPPGILLAAALAVGALALTPVVYLAIRTSEAGWERSLDIVWRARTLELLGRSVGLTAAVTTASVVIGVVLAALVTRTDMPLRRTAMALAAMPLAVPSYVAAYAWISTFRETSGLWGSVLVLTLVSYPYVFLPVAASMRGSDAAMEEAARSLGRPALRAFLTVTLRQSRPAIAAGALLVALYTLSDFGAVSLMRFDVFTRVIFQSYSASFDRTPALVLSLVLVAVTVAITVAEARTRGRARQYRSGAGASRPPAPIALTGPQRAAALVTVAGVCAAAVGFPAAVITGWLLRGQSAGLDLDRLLPAAGSTVTVSVLGAAVTAVLALPVGILAARHRGRLVRIAEHASYAGHALPGLIVALAMVFVGIRVTPDLYQRTPLLVLTYALLFLPAAVGSVRAAVALSSPRLEEAARSLGRSTLGVLRTVTVPLAAPGIAAGALLVVLTCMKELPATLLLRPTGMDTLATRLWTHTSASEYAAAAPYAAVLVLVSVPATLLLARGPGSTRRSG